jgi:2-methylcitrate dehydratase PrpD
VRGHASPARRPVATRAHAFPADDVEAIEVEVDSMTPRLLIHDRPSTELEAKFSMPFCAAAAIVFGHPTIETFAVDRIQEARVQQIIPRVTLKANTAFDAAAPLSQALVTVRLRDGRTLTERADGARGYPGRLTDDEIATKFLGCAERSLSRRAARLALQAWRAIETTAKVTTLIATSVAER